MEIKTLYKYEREPGKITVTPIEPSCEYTELYRIIANEYKLVTLDGNKLYSVVDTEIKDGWFEIDAPETFDDLEEVT